ncbi:MAG TPA: DUF445 family protein [Planktothrix sp.]|jgi:uncharacterized membrane protein YheB (UPF0754 family)
MTVDPNLVFFLKYIFPPTFYAVHGWLATWLAIIMLFHPYKPWYLIGWQLPLTPGIFPKRRSKLAQAVATTITDTLLTPDDLKRQAEVLVTEQNLYSAVDIFVDSVLHEFRDTSKLHRLAQDIADLSPVFLLHYVESVVENLEQRRDQRLATITGKIFDQCVQSLRVNYDQANEIANRVMEAFITPENVRAFLLGLLTPQNINAMDESIQAMASGPYKILARIIGIKRVCYEWRNYLEKEPEECNRILADLLKRFGIRDQIASKISNFDMRTMPLHTLEKLRENVISVVETFVIEHKTDMVDLVRKLQDEAMGTVRTAILHFNPESIPKERLARAKQDMASFMYAYLKRELGGMLERAIPALGIYTLIATKIEHFSSEQLEALVKRICKKELKALEYFGAGIGFLIGFMQIFVNMWVSALEMHH